MHCNKHDFDLRKLDLRTRGIDPIEDRHRDVEDDNVWLQLRDSIQQGTPVPDRTDQLTLIIQETPEPPEPGYDRPPTARAAASYRHPD